MPNISKIKLSDGVTYDIKDTASGFVTTDTKNTAGSTDTSSKIFLVGATSQAANPQTYSQDTAYVGTDGCLYSGSKKVVVTDDSRLSDSRPSSDVVNTYSATGTVPISGTGVAAALGTLDGTVSGSASAGKTLTAFSQTDGKVSATFGNISITKSQVSDFPTLGTAAAKAYTTSVTSGSGDLVTSGAVWTAIDNLPEPMIFKGTLGTGGTITSLPTAAAANEGFTYKVITAGTYASTAAKVGDVFVSNGSSWVLIPAGDTDSDTWRNIKVNGTQKLGSGISTGAVDFVNGTHTTVNFNSTGNKISIDAKDTEYTLGMNEQNNTLELTDNNTLQTTQVVGYKAITTSIGSASTGTAIPADDITAWDAGALPTLGTALKPSKITAWSAGSAPTLGTAIPADDITAWTTNTPTAVTPNTVVTSASGATATVSGCTLTITDGSFGTGTSCTVTAGTAASLSYTAKSIPNVTAVGSAPSLTYEAVTVPNVTGVGSLPSLTYAAKSIPNISVTPTTVATGIEVGVN